jgi:NAD-dependent SIR2 family protein deacetylase
LEGKHAKVDCAACHKPSPDTEIIIYKIERFECRDCHG